MTTPSPLQTALFQSLSRQTPSNSVSSRHSAQGYDRLVEEHVHVEENVETGPLYVSLDVELKSISVAEQRFGCGITVSMFWANSFAFSQEAMSAKTPTGHLLSFLHKVYTHISEHGNDAWAEVDPHASRFTRLYDPRQGDTWWKYCYIYNDSEGKPYCYIDLFLFLRTSATIILQQELNIDRDKIPETLIAFVEAFVHTCPTMRRFWQYTDNFSKVVHQLTSFSEEFSNLDALNRRVMNGEARFEPQLFVNTHEQKAVQWPQFCYYPDKKIMELVWEDGWVGERVEAVMQEQMELQDYPLDRQLLSLTPVDAWADAVGVPMPGVRVERQAFLNYSIAGDLLSYSQWRYRHGVLLERGEGEDRKVSYAIRVERLLMPFVASIFLPQFLIVLLALVTLIIDPEDLIDRSNLVLTLLLTAVAMYFVVKQNIPEVPYITLLEKYVSLSIVLLALMTAESAFVAFVEPSWGNYVDRISCSFVIIFWVIPHVLLVFCESRGLFRRKWMTVYRSQLSDKDVSFSSSHTDRNRQIKI